MLFSCAVFHLRCGDKLLASAQKPWTAERSSVPAPPRGHSQACPGHSGISVLSGNRASVHSCEGCGNAEHSSLGRQKVIERETVLRATSKGQGWLINGRTQGEFRSKKNWTRWVQNDTSAFIRIIKGDEQYSLLGKTRALASD